MQLGVMVDLLIGLGLIYFLLSLIATCAQEIVAGVFAWRGTYLSKGIDVILDNSGSAALRFDGLRDWLTAHFTPRAGKTVAAAFHEKVAAGTQPPSPVLQRVLDVQHHPLLRSSPTTLPSYVPARNFSTALLGALRDGSQSLLFTQVEQTIEALPAGDLKTTLTLFVQDSAGDIDAFRARLETWFDDAMDRMSGAYKRLTQYVMLVLGFILAASLNVSTPHVIRLLWETPSLRSVIVAQASRAAADAPSRPLPQVDALRVQLADFEARQFPVGWACWDEDAAPTSASRTCPDTRLRPRRLAWYILTSLPGWIMTAIAVSLGAPFWFDLLQNLMNIRNAGAKPARASDR